MNDVIFAVLITAVIVSPLTYILTDQEKDYDESHSYKVKYGLVCVGIMFGLIIGRAL